MGKRKKQTWDLREQLKALEIPGFYLLNNKITPVKFEIHEIDKEKMREALELLNELANVWFKHVQDKFAAVVKWGAKAPFIYVLKRKGKWAKWLYLYGYPATGKTTLGRIVLKMWGVDNEISGTRIDTPMRFRQYVSKTTFPILVNEPERALAKDEMIEIMKNAIDTIFVEINKYLYPAQAPFIFTSNKFLPKDNTLLRRFLLIKFSFEEKIPLEKQKEFIEKVEPRLNLLSEIGNFIATTVLSDNKILESENFGEKVLGMAYEYAGLEKPSWLSLHYDEEDLATIIVDDYREKFLEQINVLYTKHFQKPPSYEPEPSVAEKLNKLLHNNLIPYVVLKDDEVIIMAGHLKELRINYSLKSLAKKLGWEYKTVKLEGKALKAIVTRFNMLVFFLCKTHSIA